MAYVGTPRFRGNDIETLASILQGEAAGEGLQGLQAVASVIQNRAKQNFSGYGSGLVDQALARNQFQGQSSKIGPEARAVAEQLASGKLSDLTGGALYYANPGDSTASWARRLNSDNALKIGNHYFTNNAQGKPFSAPQISPAAADFVKNNPQPGGFGPAVEQAAGLAGPAPFGTMAPRPMDTSIDPNVASYAFGDDEPKWGDRLTAAGKAFDQAANAYPAPRISGGGGDARATGNALADVMGGPTVTEMLLKKRAPFLFR